MIDIEKSSKFLRDIKDDADIEKIIKQKTNLTNLLNLILKQINNDIDINSINNLKDSQIWAFIYNNSSKAITEFKSKLKDINSILNELSEFNESLNTKQEKKNLGKKTKREKEAENDELENMEEIEEEDDEINSEENENKEDVNFGKQKDIFFSMKDLNNFADQFEEEDNNEDINKINKTKSAPNKLTLSSSRNKNITSEEEENDENNSLYSEEQQIEAEIDSEEEIKYNKFFDKPENKYKKNAQREDDISNTDIDENEIFSQIKKIEEKMISNKKDWSTKGEILAKERPKDSLLTKSMDFEVGLRAPPIPDKEFTDKLEKMIKQRIIDDIFDDPIKKDFVNLNEEKKAENDLDFEKSKKGLGEIYEEKYLGNESTESKVDEIKKDCDDLCNQLFDIFKQMTNGTATPYGLKGKKEELINITNIPAIQIEEKGNFISDNTEKIKSGKEMLNIKKLRTKNKEEMTSDELRNAHNKKKRNIKNRIHQKENRKKLEQLTTMLGSKFEAKIKLKQEKNKKLEKMDKTKGKEYKSGQFFEKINDMVVKDDEKKKKNNKITQ
jgi:U3 small nucleolar RNA-associated protein MPP10